MKSIGGENAYRLAHKGYFTLEGRPQNVPPPQSRTASVEQETAELTRKLEEAYVERLQKQLEEAYVNRLRAKPPSK